MTGQQLLAPSTAPAEAPSGVSGVARGGLANLAGAALAGVAGVGVTWLVARGLGPDAAGSFFAATSAFVLVGGVARLGTSTALVYWPARLRAQGRPELIGPCLRAGLVPVAVLGTLLGAGVWLTAGWLIPDYAAPLRALAVFMPLAALTDSLLAATRGYREMRPTVLLDKVLRPAMQLCGIGALAALALTGSVLHTPAWALAWVMPYLPVVALAAYLVWRRWQREPLLDARERRAARIEGRTVASAFWRYTAPRALANSAQTALQRVDVLMVAGLAGLAPAAAYAVAGRFIVLGQLANGSIAQAVQPRLAETLAVGDRDGALRLYQTATAWLVLICWPLHLLVWDYADLYLGVFGGSYVSAAPAVRVLAVAMLIGTGCGMVDMVLSMAGRTTWNLANVLLALAVMIAIDLYAVPRLGVLGAAYGLAAAVAVNNLVPLAQLAGVLRLHPFGAATRTAMGLAVASFGLLPWLARMVLPATPLGTGAALALATGVYVGGLRRFRDRLGLAALLQAARPSTAPGKRRG
ncbi:succinoglycan biosynthesis protein ExoP [Catellatospora sp. TT07R-123]|uniref:lipopolysaccharide biosynthesis protein n=1 Tax=Catellatospora sp. TT07R-123 TaxID=2733863 RepID=UPI001B2594C3|nr:polysaccharide biosynthesis C-terminal domain-containing protein [Catellatospora sp. TT07R-123]GHJ46013.1 succinoglycan biosynthesis protein ExoP [Catellatospora sp. TT07R-123]